MREDDKSSLWIALVYVLVTFFVSIDLVLGVLLLTEIMKASLASLSSSHPSFRSGHPIDSPYRSNISTSKQYDWFLAIERGSNIYPSSA